MDELPYNINDLRIACDRGNIEWKNHAIQQMITRRISQREVIECIKSGEIIEMYADDKPIPSCLVFGITSIKRNIHVCCSYAGERIYIITTYEPDNMKWEDDLKTRKRDD